MIKMFLLALLVLLAVFVLRQRAVSQGVRMSALAVLAAGAYLVWWPERATALAKTLGVGRGADLLLYLWVIITLSLILLLYLKIVDTNRTMTLLARRIALDRPMPPRSAADEPEEE